MSDRQILYELVISILDKEIQWCNEHDLVVNKDYRAGFVKGLEQCKYLIKELAKLAGKTE